MQHQRATPDDRPAAGAVTARTGRAPAGPLLSAMADVQATAGNRAVQRLLAADAPVQRYRRRSSHNFGAADTGTLVEQTFHRRRDRTRKPWIETIEVAFTDVVTDVDGVDMPKGTATATYFSNAHALSSFSFVITGGPLGMRSDPGRFTVHRIEGVGYNDPTAAADIAATQGAGALEGPRRGRHRRYTKPGPGETALDVAASMSLAVFYNRGEALHFGDLDVASHGCVHVDDFDGLTQLNHHSVIGRTRVHVSYSGAAKATFDP